MTISPRHDELQEMLPAAALDILDRADLDRVLAHVRHCGECARTLEGYQQVTGELGLSLPRVEMDPGHAAALRTRLLARVQRDARSGAGVSKAAHGVRRNSGGAFLTGRWTGWAVAASMAGVLLMHHAVHRQLDYGWLVAGGLVVALVALGIYARLQRAMVSALRKRLDLHEPES